MANSLLAAVAYHLGQQSGVTDLVSTRIYKSHIPQRDSWPAIVLHEIALVPGYYQAAADGIIEARVQVDCWATTHSSAESIREAVYDVTAGKPASTIGRSGSTVSILDMEVENTAVEQLPPDDGGQVGDFRGRLDLVIKYRRTAPSYS